MVIDFKISNVNFVKWSEHILNSLNEDTVEYENDEIE